MSASTLFSKDLYKGFINRDADDAQMVRAGKWFGGAIAVAAIVAAPLIGAAGEQLFDLMKKFAALYNIPLLAITLVGIFIPKTPAIAAKVALITGFVFYAVFGLWQNNHLFGIKMHWLHIAGLNFALLVAITAVSPRAKPYRQRYTEEVDITPWRGAVPCGIAVVALVAIMYFALSRFG